MARFMDYVAIVEYGYSMDAHACEPTRWNDGFDVYTVDAVSDALREQGYTRGHNGVWVRVSEPDAIPAAWFARVYFKEVNC